MLIDRETYRVVRLRDCRARKGKGDPYTLDAVLLLLKNKDRPWKEYIELTSQYGCAFISRVDKKPLEEFLAGKVDTVDGLQGAPVVAAVEIGGEDDLVLAPAAGEAGDGLAPKPISVEIPSDPAALLAGVRGVERNMVDHTSVMMCPVQTFDGYAKVASAAIAEFRKVDERRKKEREKEAKSKDRQGKDANPKERRSSEAATVSGRAKINPKTGQASTRDVRMQFEEEQYRKNRYGDAKLDISEYGGGLGSAAAGEEGQIDPQAEAELAARKELEERRRLKMEARTKDIEKKRAREKEKKKAEHKKRRAEEKRYHKPPIVLMSPGFSCIINKYNAKLFLEKGEFQHWEVASERIRGNRPNPTQSVNRVFNRSTAPVKYKITEELPKSPDDWKRVCAVLVTGKKWQFKQFPKDQFKGLAESNFSNLFSKLCGFYFHYTSDPVPKDVQQWNVKRIGIDKNNRHKDTIAFRDFWTKLDEFLAEKRKRGDFEIAY